MTKGLIYTAGGKMKYVDEAVYSAKTFKKYHPDIPVTLFTDITSVKSKYIDQVIYNPPTQHPQKWKIKNMLDSPYDLTLYLDSDTEFTGAVYELFDFLQIYDLGITNRVKCKWGPNPEFIDYIDEGCFNGGFLLFRKGFPANSIIESWYEKMLKIDDDLIKPGTEFGDQKALNDIFFNEKLPERVTLKYVVLPNKIYNSRPWMWKRLKADKEFHMTKILHNHGLNKSFQAKINMLLYKFRQKYMNK